MPEYCGLCNIKVNYKTSQSCSCNDVFCYPTCFIQHQKSTGDHT